MPSLASPSLCAPSSNMGTEVNARGLVEVALREKRLTVTPLPGPDRSSITRAVMVTESVDFGMAGKWATSRTRGATSESRTELAAPGVPRAAWLGAQFWPAELGKAGL